uniref:Uncharacterized protein n=1 Tax=Lepeophtheirus salmonis TaxID=72036 RepID=A0A0K2VF85_LEPSM
MSLRLDTNSRVSVLKDGIGVILRTL